MLVFSIVEYGIMLYDKNVLTSAVRAGARYGIVASNSVYPTSASISSYITANYTSHLTTFAKTNPSPTITVTSSPSTPAKGGTLTVKITYPYACIIIGTLAGFTCPITLTATSVMQYE